MLAVAPFTSPCPVDPSSLLPLIADSSVRVWLSVVPSSSSSAPQFGPVPQPVDPPGILVASSPGRLSASSHRACLASPPFFSLA